MENKNLEETDVNEKQEVGNGKSAMPMRTCLVMILAGVYVAYLGVSLCQNVINGAERRRGQQPGIYGGWRCVYCAGRDFRDQWNPRQHKGWQDSEGVECRK